ncbi:MAG: hypothetical protein HXS47_10015 [Theionarchaea archaeon]|nr:hypothetical protein [Theionarchaea archaeon]
MNLSDPLVLLYYCAGIILLIPILGLRRQIREGTLRDISVLSHLGMLIIGSTMLLVTRLHISCIMLGFFLGMGFSMVGMIPQQKHYWKLRKDMLASMEEADKEQ